MNNPFPDLPYPPERIKKYICNLNFFMLQLDDGKLVEYTAQNKDAFLFWLRENHIPDVRDMVE